MKELELRFAADTVALLNEHRIQLRADDVAFVSGFVSGPSGVYGQLYCAKWTEFMWECSTPMGTNFGDIIPEPFTGSYSRELSEYIAGVEHAFNSEGEKSILYYAAMDTPYTAEFELRNPAMGDSFGVVAYDSDANRYAFTKASDMELYRG